VKRTEQEQKLMTPGEVARLFRVNPRTVTRWARKGRIPSVLTPGGHHRFDELEIRALFRESKPPCGQTLA
jgi:excisionase family DNA binding protein